MRTLYYETPEYAVCTVIDGNRSRTAFIHELTELEEKTLAETMDAIMEADILEEQERRTRKLCKAFGIHFSK